ncbi:MAG: bifunctional 2-polyprenyl-6-hydroxyphenol methylase/3-demethylubiquinol 3-O-methyltransferase UbiG [Proteobacteria bacterium]|nr:bifunctional 2-polyprenyl-6-hydroxyphenol methylase/3-demethylubiquinol 3-O-methyltransferase UbiG [Pseudomonadota bacterium]
MMHPAATSIDADEVARFAALADEWWDPHGGLAALHRLNPVRIAYIRDHLARHFGRDPLAERPLAGLRLLDIGCGAGLLCEPMARLGAEVIGVDAAGANIDVALRHAADGDLHIDYRHASAETLVDAGESFDAVLVMEVIEHVADLDVFFAATCALLRPGGMIVAATLNRTPQAFALAIVGAEYLLRWLKPGTHDWRKFVRPAELARRLRAGGVAVTATTGVRYRLLDDDWELSRDMSVNYMAVGVKEGGVKEGGVKEGRAAGPD